jgi:hypothetical protein
MLSVRQLRSPFVAVDSHLAGRLWWPSADIEPRPVADPWFAALDQLQQGIAREGREPT